MISSSRCAYTSFLIINFTLYVGNTVFVAHANADELVIDLLRQLHALQFFFTQYKCVMGENPLQFNR